MAALSQIFVTSPDLVLRQVGGEAVLVPIRSEVADLESVFVLNEVGLAVWQALDGRRSAEAVVDLVAEGFDGERAQIREDVSAFLDSLCTAGLARPLPGAGG